MLCTRTMSAQQFNPVESEEFGKASEKVLLDIAMQSSLRELSLMVRPSSKPTSLTGYYQSLQEWRSPVMGNSNRKG